MKHFKKIQSCLMIITLFFAFHAQAARVNQTPKKNTQGNN